MTTPPMPRLPVNPPVTLRRATADDALCLAVLGTQVFLDTYATAGIRPALAREVTAAFGADAMARQLADPAAYCLLAEHDGHLVGFAQLALDAGHELAPPGVPAELFRLYVQEPFTGRGVGSALLRAAESAAAAHGAGVLWLTPWVHNRRALGFYARHAYVDHGTTWFCFEGERHENRLLVKRLAGA